jgi:predicted unusual protein kinase regulating ubiquinone biosynthesis (AarF/ABC1/UbiB family)
MLRSSSICISFLYKYLTSESEAVSDEKGCREHMKRFHKINCLVDVFQSYGGVLAKLSQLLSFENEKSDVFSDCKPYAQKETIEYIKKEYTDNKDFFKDLKYLDFDVFKSGSVGQVHKGIYKDDQNIILKVQYLGLYEQFKSDIFILDKVASYLFYFADITSAMIDIKTKLFEELDYTIEFNNHQKIYDIWKNSEDIKIPKLVPELCTDKLIAMEFVDGEGIKTFIENSTQEERNHIGFSLINFIFTSLYKYGVFYSDIHYGNFIIKDKHILYVTDFGCLNYVEKELLSKLILLHGIMISDDEENFYHIVKDLGIMKEDISPESKKYMYEYFKLQYTPLISQDFEFTEEWLAKCVHKETELMKEWILPNNMIYFNKICYGMYHLLTKLKIQCNFSRFFKDLIRYEE